MARIETMFTHLKYKNNSVFANQILVIKDA